MISYELKIPKIPSNVQPAIKKALWESAMLVRRSATQKAPYKSWALRRSIIEYSNGNTIEIGSNLVYAAIHEWGWVITPKRSKYLTFRVNGKRVRTKRVVIPARPFMGPALRENTNKILEIFNKHLARLLE